MGLRGLARIRELEIGDFDKLAGDLGVSKQVDNRDQGKLYNTVEFTKETCVTSLLLSYALLLPSSFCYLTVEGTFA
ncbi:hypothetical protein L596_022460 [Steinernema carpocapsae]|uniref:Uncharacterized protein n=1 Tax=Steinernema carpocapsae TaxID=34508 RepID=A0A4U5MLS7_STECR|nr:hypothetical protein L596_022460 [Steinernema carpocapsae]